MKGMMEEWKDRRKKGRVRGRREKGWEGGRKGEGRKGERRKAGRWIRVDQTQLLMWGNA